MPNQRVTVSIDEALVEQIRALVNEGKARSTSSFVARAVVGALQETSSWHDMLTEALEKTGGPMTDEERDWADSVLTP